MGIMVPSIKIRPNSYVTEIEIFVENIVSYDDSDDGVVSSL